MSLISIGSIATHILENFNNIPDGVSGNMDEIVDMARQHVENYTDETIGSNSIAAKYQPAIVNFSKADTIDMVTGQEGGETIKLDVLSVSETGEQMSAKQWRSLADSQLRALGIKTRFARSLS